MLSLGTGLGLSAQGGVPPWRNRLMFVSPHNNVPTLADVAATTGRVNVRIRMPFSIAHGVSSIVAAIPSWYANITAISNVSNAFKIEKLAIEINGDSYSVPVTFGGLRTATINPGDPLLLSDRIPASAFSRAHIAADTQCFWRFEYSVASAGLKLPQGKMTTSGIAAARGITIDPAVFNGFTVDDFGSPTLGTNGGATNFLNPLVPFALGTFYDRMHPVWMGVGDSITEGGQDGLSGYNMQGGFQQALANTDHTTGFRAGCNAGKGSAKGSLWGSSNAARIIELLQYANYGYEAFGANEFVGAGTTVATALADSRIVWDLMNAAGYAHILRPPMIPRCLNDGTGLNPYTSEWAAGGTARSFNSTLIAGTGLPSNMVVMPANGLRKGTDPALDTFYQWANVINTADGTHPNAAGAVILAADIRAAFAAYS